MTEEALFRTPTYLIFRLVYDTSTNCDRYDKMHIYDLIIKKVKLGIIFSHDKKGWLLCLKDCLLLRT